MILGMCDLRHNLKNRTFILQHFGDFWAFLGGPIIAIDQGMTTG